MKRESLTVQKRTVTGKKVKKLRREGILPANIYGKDFKSTEVQLSLKEFDPIYREVRETGLVDLKLDGQTIPVLIKNVHTDPRTQDVLHADFHKVNLKEKIEANIPIAAVGEPLAVLEKKGILLQLLNELSVEALPTELPEKIEVSIEKLAEVDDQITVAQLSTPSGVTVLNEPSQGVFKIGELPKEEVIVPPPVEEAAEGEAKVPEGEEGGKVFEKEASPADKTSQSKEEKTDKSALDDKENKKE